MAHGSIRTRRLLLNSKSLTYVVGSLILLYLGHDFLMETLHLKSDPNAQDRMKREAESETSSADTKSEDDSVVGHNDEDPALSRLARKILNESESFIEEGGTKRPISVKELNMNYTAAKEAFYAPKPECIPKPPEGGGGAPPAAADAAPPPPPAERRRKKRQAADKKLPYCEDMKKGAAAGAPPPAADAPEAPPPPPAE